MGSDNRSSFTRLSARSMCLWHVSWKRLLPLRRWSLDMSIVFPSSCCFCLLLLLLIGAISVRSVIGGGRSRQSKRTTRRRKAACFFFFFISWSHADSCALLPFSSAPCRFSSTAAESPFLSLSEASSSSDEESSHLSTACCGLEAKKQVHATHRPPMPKCFPVAKVLAHESDRNNNHKKKKNHSSSSSSYSGASRFSLSLTLYVFEEQDIFFPSLDKEGCTVSRKDMKRSIESR